MPSGAGRKSVPCLSPTFLQLPWRSLSCRHCSNPCLCLHVTCFPVCLLPFSSLIRTPVPAFRTRHLPRRILSWDPWLNYICKDAFSKQGYIHRFWLDKSFVWLTNQPITHGKLKGFRLIHWDKSQLWLSSEMKRHVATPELPACLPSSLHNHPFLEVAWLAHSCVSLHRAPLAIIRG